MPPKFELDASLVRKMAKLLNETGLSEIEYAEGDKKIRCAVDTGPVLHPIIPAAAAPAGVPVTEAEIPSLGTPVPSPMVGTVYLGPAPDAVPFVKAGDKVKAGDTLLIIEAMKVMNPIKAPIAGTVADILVSNASPVEFGETLLVIG